MPFVYRLQKILDFRIRKKEEQLLNSELKANSSNDEYDFFKDFMGEEDTRFDDDLIGMIDEISQDILDEDGKTVLHEITSLKDTYKPAK